MTASAGICLIGPILSPCFSSILGVTAGKLRKAFGGKQPVRPGTLARTLNQQVLSAEYSNKIYSLFNIFGYVIGARRLVIPTLLRDCVFDFECIIYIDFTSCACGVRGETYQH